MKTCFLIKPNVLYTTIQIVIAVIFFSSCGTTKNSAREKDSSIYIVKFVPKAMNEYEGNIIVKTFNSNGKALKGTTVFINSENRKISELELTSTFTGVFYENIKSLTVKATKPGYHDCETEMITMIPDKACYIELNMVKKKNSY